MIGLCAFPTPSGLDLAEVTTAAQTEAETGLGLYTVEGPGGEAVRVWADDLAEARALCMACPRSGACRDAALADPDIPGFAGGLTEAERDRSPRPVTTYGGTVTGDILTEVARLTTAGMTAREIARTIDAPGVTHSTVAYARQLLTGSKHRKAATR